MIINVKGFGNIFIQNLKCLWEWLTGLLSVTHRLLKNSITSVNTHHPRNIAHTEMYTNMVIRIYITYTP